METISRSLLTFLLNSLWQVPVAVAVAALACRCMRRGSGQSPACRLGGCPRGLAAAANGQHAYGIIHAVSAIRPIVCGRGAFEFRSPRGYPAAAHSHTGSGFPNHLVGRHHRDHAAGRLPAVRALSPCAVGVGILPHRPNPPRGAIHRSAGHSRPRTCTLRGGVRRFRCRTAGFPRGSGSGHGRTGDHPSGVSAGGAARGRAHDRHRSRNGAHRAARLRLQSVVRSAPTADRFSSGRLADSSRDRADSRNGLR